MNLIFTAGTKLLMIRISNHDIFWNDAKNGLHRLYPTPDEYAVRMGGQPTREELAEYNMCKTEQELAAFCIRDCQRKGIKLVKVESK